MLAPYQSEHETLNSNLRSSVFGPWGFGVWSGRVWGALFGA